MKLKDTWIEVDGPGGATFKYKASTTVTEGGVFSIELHDDLADIAEALKPQAYAKGCPVSLNYNYKKWWVTAQRLNDAAAFIKMCADDLLKCETKVERIIVYGYRLQIHFWKNADGTIEVNGAGASDGGWFKGSHQAFSTDRVPFYSVGFAARVMDKKFFIRASGTTVEYDLVRDSKEEAIHFLNSMVHLDVDPSHEQDYKQMPYTPEAAQFFTSVMVNMCKLADQIHGFFSDEARLLETIHSGKLLKF